MLTPGTKFGPYEIIAALGAGGMGEVYRARDSRLEREVAIKILPVAWSNDAERLRRFENEARAAGQLNHPNILSVYDFGLQEGAPYLVAELLEGESLRERMTPPVAMAPRKAIEIAAQVARGLAAAHAQGVVHRDLKPENIFLTRAGQVKILDFGLAKVRTTAGDDAPTMAAGEVTSAGSVLGTAGYMSPEQARGGIADARSDLFSLGAVLYEMVAGRRAFQKDSAVETMSAVIKEDPPAAAIEPPLQRVLDHCLEKNPAARFQSAHDLEFALAALAGTATTARASAVPARRQLGGWLPAALGVGGLIVGALLVYFLARPAAPAPAPGVRFQILPPAGSTLAGGMALSPDGRKLAYVAVNANGQYQLWLRRMGSLDAQPLAGTEGAQWPFWSPDGTHLGFFGLRNLSTFDLSSAAVQPLYAAPYSVTRGGTWGAGGMIVFQPVPTGPLMKIAAQGGSAEPATTGTQPGGTDRWPQFLPDGQHFIFLRFDQNESDGTLLAGSLADSTPHVIAGVPKLESQAIDADGELLYSLHGNLTSQPFDWRRQRATGPPRSLSIPLSPMGLAGATGALAVTASQGLLAWYAQSQPLTQLALVNNRGELLRKIGAPASYLGWSLSPDGKTIAVSQLDAGGSDAIWLLDVASGAPRRLTFSLGQALSTTWSPDGQWLYYGLAPGGVLNVYRKRVDGTGTEEKITDALHGEGPNAVSPDGRTLLYTALNGKSYDLGIMPLSPRGPGHIVEHQASYGQFSPDGRWIAYSTHLIDRGTVEVFVMPNPPGGSRWQVSPTSGSGPMWAHDGKELFYVSNREMMAVQVLPAPAGTFAFSAPQAMFPVSTNAQAAAAAYQSLVRPLPDGKGFLIGSLSGPTTSDPGITVVTGWKHGLVH